MIYYPTNRVQRIRNSIQTEEATKTSIILPFFQLLGYDVFNPCEFVPEYTADVGIKKNEKVKIKPIIYGGGQQNNLRSGTENVPGIAGLAKAAEILYGDLDGDVDRLYELKQRFIDGVTRSTAAWWKY